MLPNRLGGTQQVNTAAGIFLCQGSEDQAQNDRRHSKVQLDQDKADHTHDEHQENFLQIVVQCEGACNAECHDDRHQIFVGYIDDLAENTNHRETANTHQDIGNKQSNEHDVSLAGFLGEQGRPEDDTLHRQRTHHDRGTGIAGDTQSQQGHERTTGDSVVGGLGTCDTLRRAVTELFGMLGEALGHVIAHPRGNIAAGSGYSTDEGTQNGGPDHRGSDGLQIILAGKDPFDFNALMQRLLVVFLLNGLEHLCESKHADQDGDHSQTALEEGAAKGKAVRAGKVIHTHGSKQQAQNTAHQTLDHGFSGHTGDDADAEKGQRKVLRGLEVQGHLCQIRSAEHQYHAAEQSTAQG